MRDEVDEVVARALVHGLDEIGVVAVRDRARRPQVDELKDPATDVIGQLVRFEERARVHVGRTTSPESPSDAARDDFFWDSLSRSVSAAGCCSLALRRRGDERRRRRQFPGCERFVRRR